MTPKHTLRVSGYVAEVACGLLPLAAKTAFTRHIVENRDRSTTPAWMLKRIPRYVSTEEIKRVWYEDPVLMQRLMETAGTAWHDFRDLDTLFHRTGFGGGKDGVGLFEIGVYDGARCVLEFVPYDPLPGSDPPGLNLSTLALNRLPSPALPPAPRGHVIVCAGTWGKGVLEFPLPRHARITPGDLSLDVLDLTPFGIGEDHFVAGLRYQGKALPGETIHIGDREGYPVTWFSPEQGRWMEMYEER